MAQAVKTLPEILQENERLRTALQWIADDPCTNIEAAFYAKEALGPDALLPVVDLLPRPSIEQELATVVEPERINFKSAGATRKPRKGRRGVVHAG